MASIDFPNSPTDGQTFTAGNATYTYIASKGYWDAVTTTVGIQLTDLSIGAENPADGDGAIAYDNSTGVFTYTPPVISAGGIALTDLSIGAENPADGDGAIAYDNSTGVFTYTPPVISGGLPSQTGNSGAFLTTDGSAASWDTLVSTTKSLTASTTIVNPNAYGTSASDQFGVAVTTDGTNVYVYAAEAGAPNGGSVIYVYNASTKGYLYTVTAPIVTSGFGYPYARAADGYLVVPTYDAGTAAPSGNNVGRVHIFNSADGSFVRTISRTGASTSWSSVGSDAFGFAVGTANGKTIVGAYYAGLQGATRPAGEALLYDNATGSLLHTFSNPSSPVVDGDDFGRAVAMANNYILIGAMGEDQAGTNFGVVYVYDATTYALIRTITPSAGIFIGWDIVLDTTGEYFYTPFSSNVGKVYEIATGTVALTISPPAGATAAWGVNGFAMTEEYVIIADPSYNTYGRVHYYNKTTGAEVFTVDSPASTGTIGLGYHSITSVGTSVFVSNKNATGDGNTNSGEIYVIEPLVTRTFSDDAAFTGAVTIGGAAPLALTDLSVGAENPADGDGAIAYDNSTGVFTYTPPAISGGVDTASVEAAGALMDSELTNIAAVKALDQGVATTASPTFAGLTLSGVPTAPTAAAGTNTTQIATTEFTTTALANLVDTAPATLDTLNELAAALGDDPNFATAITNSIALKAPLISPSFTGPVTVTGTTTLDGITTLNATTETTSLGVAVFDPLGTQQKIQASDKLTTAQFGFSASISGDGLTAIVGANGTGNGAAYVYTRSTASISANWTQQAKIVASDGQLYDYFGASVSISSDGNTVIVGADYEDTGASNAGAAYIFVRSGTSWSQQAKIQSSDKEASDFFGSKVGISGDGNTAIVGANGEDTGGSNAGAAYIFTRSGTSWSEQAKIQSSDIEAGDYFGYSVSISGDGNIAIVGAWYEDTGATDAGAAYIFTRSGTSWSEQAKIQATDKAASDQFGVSVSISDDGLTAIIGANGEDTGASGAGAAYIFTRSGTTWSQQAKIQASDLEAGDQFGNSVSISSDGNTAIVSAWVEDPAGTTNAGSAYVFKRYGTTWTETQKIQASDKEVSDYFGMSVGISGDGSAVIVGARGEDTGASDAGAAYIYAADISSIVLHDVSQSSVFIHSSVAADFTANFANVPTTDDRTLSVALIISQGATGYLPTALQIDGAAQTILWQDVEAPTATPSATDIASFTFIRSAGAWTVLGTVTAFGAV